MRTVYSANVSDFTSVILMSPYISESSGQYLEHFTCKERTDRVSALRRRLLVELEPGGSGM